MSTHGTVGPFVPGREDWVAYTEWLQQYFAANDVDSANKQCAILLSSCGADTYQVIRNLVAPLKPSVKSFKQIVDLVREHYCPQPSAIVQRFAFNNRVQQRIDEGFRGGTPPSLRTLPVYGVLRRHAERPPSVWRPRWEAPETPSSRARPDVSQSV